MLSLFLGSVVEAVDLAAVVVVEGRVAVRAAVVEVVVRLLGVVVEASLPAGLVALEAAVRELVAEPATLDRRSAVEVVVVFNGARVEVVPAMDMRFAVPEIPARFSSPELANDRFSSAELLIDARDRCDAVVDVLSGLRVADVVVGRVGGLLKVLELVVPRVVEVAVFEAVVEVVGRLAVVVPDTGRLAVVELLTGEALAFSLDASGLDLTASGLDFTTSGLDLPASSLPERIVDSIGVAGGAISTSTGVAGGAFSTSVSAAMGTESSVDAMSVCASI